MRDSIGHREKKVRKALFGAIALTQELKSFNNVSDNFSIKEILSVFRSFYKDPSSPDFAMSNN